jgi:hypothetical protein
MVDVVLHPLVGKADVEFVEDEDYVLHALAVEREQFSDGDEVQLVLLLLGLLVEPPVVCKHFAVQAEVHLSQENVVRNAEDQVAVFSDYVQQLREHQQYHRLAECTGELSDDDWLLVDEVHHGSDHDGLLWPLFQFELVECVADLAFDLAALLCNEPHLLGDLVDFALLLKI